MKCIPEEDYIPLTYQNMKEEMKGMLVSIIPPPEEAKAGSRQGRIQGWDERNIHIKVGSKKVKLPYNPKEIMLCVYQHNREEDL